MEIHKHRILLVEDEALVRMDLAMMLKEMGYSLIEASSADHALDLLNGSIGFELLVTDIDMPGAINGLALAFAVCETLPHCLILIISGGQSPRTDEMPAGSLFLSKPVVTSDLRAAIRALNSA